MPSGKHRDFDDTWNKEELEKSLKGSKDDKRKPKDRDRERDKDRDRDKNKKKEDDDRRRRREDDDGRKPREENGDVDKKHRSSRGKDETNRDKDRRDRRPKEGEREENGRDERHRRHRDENDEDREKRHRRHRDEEGGDRERRHRKPRDDQDEERDENRHQRHRDEDDEDRESRHRKHRDDNDERERRHRKHRDRDYENNEDTRDKDKEKERRDRKQREEQADKKPRRKEETEEERRRRKEKERERERRHRDDKKEDDRRGKTNEDNDDERRRRHEEKKKMREREREEQKEKEREEENEKQRQRDKERKLEREKKERRDKEKQQAAKGAEKKKEQKEEKNDEDEDDGYGDYDDDFEDYDDDFEDEGGDDENEDGTSNRENDSESEAEGSHPKGYFKSLDWDAKVASNNEVDDVMKAMNEENERLMAQSKRMQEQSKRRNYDEDSADLSEDDDQYQQQRSRGRPKTAQRTFINFVSAKQREITGKAASKTMRRAKELRELIELDVAKFDLFDMPPVNEYELYMRSFGGSNTRQAYVQTNEDNIDREIQTEEIDTREIWVQNTPDAIENVGGPEFEKKEDDYETQSPQEALLKAQRWERLVNATLILLEEDSAERVQQVDVDGRKKSNICLSEAFMELQTESLLLLKERTVIYSQFSPVQTNLLLTVHNSKQQEQPDISTDNYSNQGVICVWNVNSPNYPQKVLLCESRPRCCCFSPSKATLAFAGMNDGSILVWDLRESSDMHKLYMDGETELVLRYPTYSTAGVLQYDNHQSAVIAVQPIVSTTDSSSENTSSAPSSGEDGEGLSFQLASLEENSVINLWVVAEISHSDPAGSESDLGLSPGGRVKLIKSSTIQLESPLRDARLRTTMQAFDMKLLPSNNSHYYVATDSGCVIHGVRYGGKAPPRAHCGEIDSPIKITAIDFSPFPESVFLVGGEDGSLRLHHTSSEYPLITWFDTTGGSAIQAIRWSRSRPSVFFVLDANSRMHIWDLLMSDAVPMKFEQVAEERVTSIDLCNDHNATGIGLSGRKPQMVISLESGATEVHTLSGEFCALMSDEMDQFKSLIQRIT